MTDERGELEARLAAVEERLAALESRPRRAPVSVVADDEELWVLAGLQERVGDDGTVVYAGTVELPGGERYVWQQAAQVATLLETDPDDLVPAIAALGHRVRLMLVQAVLAGRRTVAELEALESLGTTGQLYHHLRQLVAAGWLQNAGRGRYAVPGDRVVALLVVLTAVGPAQAR
jgi:hypothetical protein